MALISVAKLLRNVKTRTFDYSAAVRAHAEKVVGAPITCSKGCAHCCYSKICIDAGTGMVIALELQAQGRWTPELVKRLTELDAEMTRTSHHDWFNKRQPCVFLAEREWGVGTCTVHSVRPAACVATFSALPPVECSVGDNKASFQVADEHLVEHLMPYQEALLNGAGETSLWLMTIPGAVLYGYSLAANLPPPPTVLRLAKEDGPKDDAMALVNWLDENGAAQR
jgi:Fe-S-cluster containining protein